VRLLIVLSAAGALVLAGTSAGAKSASSLRSQAASLRAENAALEAASHRALLELYVLDTKLAQSEQHLAALSARQSALARQERTAQLALGLARTSEQEAQKALRERARALYINGEPDPLAVIFDASSLDDLISTIDSVNRAAHQDEVIIGQLHRTHHALQGAMAALLKRQAALARLTEQAQQARATLASARSDKLDYLASLSKRKALNAREIATLTDAAADAEQKAASISPPPQAASGGGSSGPAPSPAATDESPAPGRQVTVAATMYCLRGSTATGIPVGPGVVATDPSYIPLGTKMYIPGYGDGVAADTGGAVVGWTIDMWVASCAQADAYGRQSITITIFD